MAVAATAIDMDDPVAHPDEPPPATGTGNDPGGRTGGRRPSPPANRAKARRRWAFRGAAATILLLAAVLRLLPIGASLPYPGYVDEGHTLHHGAKMVVEQTMDPGWYDYPTFPIAVSGAILVIAGLPSSEAKRSQDLEATAFGRLYDEIRPARGLVGTRLFTGALGVATVGLVMLATARLDRRRVALIAGTVAAFMPAMVQRGLFDLVDTMATFFVCGAFVAGLAVVHATRRSRRVGWTIVAGICCGLAAGTKYPNGAALIMAAILVGVAAQGSVVKRVVRTGIVGVAAGVAFLVTMPAVLVNRTAVIASVTKNYDRYAAKNLGPRYWESAAMTTEVGIVVLVAAAVGMVLLLRRRSTRAPTIAWVVYAVVIVAVAARLQFQPFRNLLSIIPFVCIAAAVGIDAVVRGIAGRVGGGHRRVADVAILGVVAVLVVYLTIGGIRPFLDGAMKADTRTLARGWLEDNVAPGDAVTVMAELAMTKPELDKIPGSVTVISAVDGSVVREPASPPSPDGAHYVVTGTLADAAYPWMPEPGLEQTVSFGSRRVAPQLNFTRGNNAAVFIFASPG